MNWVYNLLVSLDQLFNAIAGGNPDCTISSHCDTMAYIHGGRWSTLRTLIDYTFAPIEENHCYNSMMADSDVDDKDNFIPTALIAVIGCAVLFLPIRVIKLINKTGY